MGKGEIMALACAAVWAVAIILFKRVGEVVAPFHLNLFKNTVGTIAFGLTLLVLREAWVPVEPGRLGLLCLSGVIGITVADGLLFGSLQLLGAGRMAVVDCLYTPSMALCALLMLGEPITGWHLAGGCLVVAGVLVASFEPDAQRSREQLRRGVLMGAASMGLMSVGILMVKGELDDLPVFQFAWIRLAASVAAALLFLAFTRRLRELAWLRRPEVPRVQLVVGSLLGAWLAMVLWVAGLKYAVDVTTAAILNQTSVFFIIALAAVFLSERLTWRKLVGAGFGVGGVVLATLGASG